MLIFQCDICGKDSTMTNVKFSPGPILIRKKNFQGKMYRVFLHVGILAEDDYNEMLHQMGVQKIYDVDEDESIFTKPSSEGPTAGNFGMKIMVPNPMACICDMCKKTMSTEILNKAKYAQCDMSQLYTSLPKPQAEGEQTSGDVIGSTNLHLRALNQSDENVEVFMHLLNAIKRGSIPSNASSEEKPEETPEEKPKRRRRRRKDESDED